METLVKIHAPEEQVPKVSPIYQIRNALQNFDFTLNNTDASPITKLLHAMATKRMGSYSQEDLETKNLSKELQGQWLFVESDISIADLQDSMRVFFLEDTHQKHLHNPFSQEVIERFIFDLKSHTSRNTPLLGAAKDALHRLTSINTLLLSQSDISTIDSIQKYITTTLKNTENTHTQAQQLEKLQTLLIQTILSEQSSTSVTLTRIEKHALMHLLISLHFIDPADSTISISNYIQKLFTKETLAKQDITEGKITNAYYAIGKSMTLEVGSIPPIFIEQLRAFGNPNADKWLQYQQVISREDKKDTLRFRDSNIHATGTL